MSTALLVPTASIDIDGSAFQVTSGEVTLDSSAVPYCSASYVLPFVDDAYLDWLDPREDRRIESTAGVGVPRAFDLGLRSRMVDHSAKTTTITVASDEALLQDYATLVVDKGARAYEASLRGVTNYVLGKIGAALEAGTSDADVTAIWEVQNLIANPAPTSLVGYRLGSGSSTLTYDAGLFAVRWTTTALTSNLAVGTPTTNDTFRVTPGKSYVFAVEVVSSNVSARTVEACLNWRNNGGAASAGNSYGTAILTSSAVFQRVHVIATAPPGAEFVTPIVITRNNAVSTTHYAKQFILYEGSDLVPYFDGATTDTATYDYSWDDATEAPVRSSSTRTPLVPTRPPDMFTWNPGTSAWDFLMALTSMAGMVLWCDELRRWYLDFPENRTITSQVYVSGLNASAGEDELSRDDRDAFVTGVVVRYSWIDEDGISREQYDTAGTSDLVMTIELEQAYPGPGAAAAILARRQGTGRVQRVTAITEMDTTPGMSAQISLPGAPDTIGRVTGVTFDLATGFMDLRTSGLVDVVPGSIMALAGTIDSLAGTINSL